MDSLRIDSGDLVRECSAQAFQFNEAGQAFVKATANAKMLKSKLELMEAELSLAIRENPEAFGIEKITEGAVKSAILTDRKYIKAGEELQGAEEEASSLQVLKDAWSQRSSMLKAEVDLKCKMSFSADEETPYTRVANDRMEEVVQKRMKKKS